MLHPFAFTGVSGDRSSSQGWLHAKGVDSTNPNIRNHAVKDLVMRIVIVVVAFFLQMMHRPAVPFAECMPVVVHELALHPWMLVPVMIVGIAVGAGFEIMPGGLDAIIESSALCLAILRWRFIPASLSLILSR